MNVLRWCPFVHLFDTPFRNSPYGRALDTILVFFETSYVEKDLIARA